MVDFRIDVVLDPTKAVAGSRAVEKELAGLEQEAFDLRRALVDALSVRDQGTAAALGRIENILDATGQRAIITDARISQLGKDARISQLGKDVLALNNELDRTGKKAAGVGSLLRRAFAGVSAVLVAREYVQLSDALTNASNRLRLVTSSSEELKATQQELFAIAERTRSGFAGTAEIFNRVALSGKDLGVTNQQLLGFTESLNQAIILSGANATEANAGLIQLSQGLASGALRGDELRSVLEQLPAVADVIAKSLGVTRGELRELGQQGAITAQVVLKAFAEARGELNDRFATTVPTIGQAFEVLKNKVAEQVAAFNESSGAAELLSRTLLGLGENLDVVLAGVSVLGGALALSLAAKAIPAAIAGVKALGAAATTSLGAVTILGTALVVLSESIQKEFAAIDENFRLLEADARIVNGLGTTISNMQRELAALGRVNGQLSESQASRVQFLKQSIEDLRGTIRGQAADEKVKNEQTAAAAEAAKIQAGELERQNKILQDLRGPAEAYAQFQRDLDGLLRANTISQEEFNRALADAGKKPGALPETPKPVKIEAADDPFAKQLESLRLQNEELAIRANNLGIQREGLLIELDLQREGVTLTAEQQGLLADALILRQQTNAELEKQKTTAEAIAKTESERVQRAAQLKEEIDLQGQLNNEILELARLRETELALIPQIDAAIEGLRLRQLEASKELGDGFERALLKIKQEAEDLAAVGEAIVGTFANTATDAIVQFAQTGQFAFKEFAVAILSDITRIIARLLVVQALNAVLGSTTGGSLAGLATTATSSAQNSGRARGGTVQGGQAPFPVGEEGPEMFVPGRTGTIVPNAATLQQAPPQVNVQVVNVQDPNAVPQAINDGAADDAIVNVLTRKRDALRQLQA